MTRKEQIIQAAMQEEKKVGFAQIADDRMTLTNQRMTDAHALDEIKCLAKDSAEFITKYYKTQKGE